MKLIELDPRWVGAGGEGISDRDGNPVPKREGIGVAFDCPCGCGSPCFIPFSNPLDGGPPVHEATWTRTGETFETLTLTPSIKRVDGCRWHGFITNGFATGQKE
jgi:hypothetical protein